VTSPQPIRASSDNEPAALTEHPRVLAFFERRGNIPVLALLAAMIIGWGLLIRRFGEGDVYAVVGPYALAVCIVMIALRPKTILAWLKPTKRGIWVGLAVGVAITVLTYPAFQLASLVYPELDGHVQSLYTGARSTTLAKALCWVIALVLAEELMFRGVLPDELSARMSERNAWGLSLIIYSLAQFGTGSVIVSLMALAYGSVWTWQRQYTDSLLSTVIAHLIWTPTVILLYPVT
jgi:membrane protease YdiL (CAAX protease family)